MWPFSKPETAVADPRQTAEYRAGFTDAVLDYALRQAGGNAGASATETAAVIFGMGCLQAAFSMADVEPEELRPTLTPMVLGAMAQQLALKGNSVWDILVNEGDPFPTLRAGTVETITGGPDPRGWIYQMAFEGPSATETLVRLYSDVVHARINTDPLKPWQGFSSLSLAGVTAALLASVEQRISEEANARVGYLLNYPDGTSDTTINGIRGDVGAMRGGVMLAETGGAGFRAGLPGGNPSDWRKTRLGAEIPATSLQARTEAVRDCSGGNACAGRPVAWRRRCKLPGGLQAIFDHGRQPQGGSLGRRAVRKARTVDNVQFPAVGGSGHSESGAGDGRNGIGGSAA